MRTRAKGNVLDAVSYPIGGIVLGNTSFPVIGGVVVPDGLGVNQPALIIDGDQAYLFPMNRSFSVVGGPNAGSYTVTAPGAQFNTDVAPPHISKTTEIPVASVTSTLPGGSIDDDFGIDLSGTVITNSGTPVNANDVASKGYVDGSLSSIVLGPANLSPGTYAIDISGDASTLDGLDSTQFLRSDTDDILQSGSLTIQSATTEYVSFNDTTGNQNPGVRMLTSGSVNAGALLDNINSVATGYLRLFRYTSGGATAAQIQLFEDGNITIDPTGSTTNAGNFNVTGAIVATGNITAFSDIRLKENIKTIDNAMDKIVQIGGYTYTRSDLDDAQHVGVIAQEIQQILPEAVVADAKGMLSVAYGNLVALLIEGMKEQKKEIDALKKRLDAIGG